MAENPVPGNKEEERPCPPQPSCDSAGLPGRHFLARATL